MSLLEELPFDVLEFQIFYYLNGLDIWALCQLNKSLQQRLHLFLQVLCNTKFHTSMIWPNLDLDGFTRIDDFKQLNLQKWKLKFLAISIDGNNFLRLNNHLPKTTLLTLNVTRFSNFVTRKNRLNCSVENVTCIDIAQMGNHQNIDFGIFKEMNLNEIRLGECQRPGFEKFMAVLPSLHITKLSLSMSLTTVQQVQTLCQEIWKLPINFLALCMMTLTNASATYLAEMLPKSNITELLIMYSEIGKPGLDTIARVLPDTKLKALRFENANPEGDLYFELFKILPKTQITKLWCDNISDDEVQEIIVENIGKTQITNAHLYIENAFLEKFLKAKKLEKFKNSCVFGDVGCEILANNYKHLPVELDATDCSITSYGLKLLLEGICKSDVKSLLLSGNDFGNDGFNYLKLYLKNTLLERLVFGNSCQGYIVRKNTLDDFFDGLESNLKSIQINNVFQNYPEYYKRVLVEYYIDPGTMSIFEYKKLTRGISPGYAAWVNEANAEFDEDELFDYSDSDWEDDSDPAHEDLQESDYIHEESQDESE
ncbi:hypothetical protein HDV01_002505 [Terramyces sp. JEL0728]|nr:hypothetical protein HDV01_002505 [Terramyces sp. JEL0728]